MSSIFGSQMLYLKKRSILYEQTLILNLEAISLNGKNKYLDLQNAFPVSFQLSKLY